MKRFQFKVIPLRRLASGKYLTGMGTIRLYSEDMEKTLAFTTVAFIVVAIILSVT